MALVWADHLGHALRDGRWLAESLGPVLTDLARYRGPAAHKVVAVALDARRDPAGGAKSHHWAVRLRRRSREEVIRWRQRILGIGCEGVLARLAGLQPLRP